MSIQPRKLPREVGKPSVASTAADKHFQEAANWDADHRVRSMQSERRAWLIAGAAGLVATLSVAANFMLFPLKEIQHVIVRVDSVTGLVDVQRQLKDSKPTYAEATDKYWLKLYVRQREGFMFAAYDDQYRSVGLLSSAQEQKRWYDYFRTENPASPVNQLGQRAAAKVAIRSVSFLDKGLATVRFTRTVEQFNAPTTQTFWIATIKYRYVNAPMTEADREINPIGFQVAEYRIDPETDIAVEVPK